MKLRYKDPMLRSKQWVWIKGKDAYRNFQMERLSVRRRRTIIGRKLFKLVDRIVVQAS